MILLLLLGEGDCSRDDNDGGGIKEGGGVGVGGLEGEGVVVVVCGVLWDCRT